MISHLIIIIVIIIVNILEHDVEARPRGVVLDGEQRVFKQTIIWKNGPSLRN